MLRRNLLIAIPAAATAVVAFVLLGPGQERTVLAARVLAAGDELRAIRLTTVARGNGEAATPLASLALFVDDEPRPRWTGSTTSSGVAEVVLDPPITADATLRVEQEGAILAAGAIRPRPAARATRGTARAASFEQHGLTLMIDVTRGALVPPFAEQVRISVRTGERPVPHGTVNWSAVSADPSEGKLELGPEGDGVIMITPLAQPVLLSVSAQSGELTVTGETALPVATSGLYLVPAARDGGFEIVSSGPRTLAFLSIYDDRGRVSGAPVDLTLDDKGFYRGKATVEVAADAVAVVVSGDAAEKGPSTVVWPPPGTVGGAQAPRLEVVLDGMGDAVARERKRIARVRTLAIATLSLAAALEIALLLWAGRKERENLEQLGRAFADSERVDDELASVADPSSAGMRVARTQGWLVVVVAVLVVLSFVAIAELAVR